MKRQFRIISSAVLQRALAEVSNTPVGAGKVVVIQDEGRNLDQSAKFHAICGDLAKSQLMWAGKRRSLAQWKNLLVSGHSKATEEEYEIVPGIEGEYVSIRESTALMSKKRAASLIEYTLAFCAMNGVKVHQTADDGINQGE